MKLLIHYFHSSFNECIFPEQLKVAKVSSIFKVCSYEKVGNYRPILVLPIFSKVLERIMHNRAYKCLTCYSRYNLALTHYAI